MYLTLRVDLDYVPWDTPDAEEFGHGEPAALLRLLGLARSEGYKFHFFASNRALKAFPAGADAVLGEGHDLDWLCKHPEDAGARHAAATNLFANLNHEARGLAVRERWPAEYRPFAGLEGYRFLSAESGGPQGLRLFPVRLRSLRQVVRSGQSVRAWTDSVKAGLAGVDEEGITLAVRPQTLARFDPRLTHLDEILRAARDNGLRVMTLRDVLAG